MFSLEKGKLLNAAPTDAGAPYRDPLVYNGMPNLMPLITWMVFPCRLLQVAPCECKGDTRYVHLNCLQKWHTTTSENKVGIPSHVAQSCPVCSCIVLYNMAGMEHFLQDFSMVSKHLVVGVQRWVGFLVRRAGDAVGLVLHGERFGDKWCDVPCHSPAHPSETRLFRPGCSNSEDSKSKPTDFFTENSYVTNRDKLYISAPHRRTIKPRASNEGSHQAGHVPREA